LLAHTDEPLRDGPRKVARLTLTEEARVLAQGMPDGLLLVDDRGRILFANDRLLAMTGHTEGGLVGSPVEVLVPAALKAAHVRHRRGFESRPMHRPTGTTAPAFSVQRADGTVFPADIALNPTRWADRDVVVVVVSDLTARRRADALRSMQFAVTRLLSEAGSLSEAGPRLLEVMAATLEMEFAELRLRVPGGGLTVSSSWLAPSLGTAEREVFTARSGRGTLPAGAGPPPLDLAPVVVLPVLRDGQVIALFEFFHRGGRGATADAQESVSNVADQISQFVHRRRAEVALEESVARLAEVAATDPLTGIRNRREFDRLVATIPRRRFAVLTADLDNLKRINDEYGHEAGDVALRAVASTLVAALRGWDVVARTGGDEFSVLMSDVSAHDAARAAERVRAVVKAISVPYGQVSISVGWAAGAAGSDPRDIVELADAHLYEAKRAGRDRVVGAPRRRRGGLGAHRSEWSARIDEALAQRDLTILFQPIVRLRDGALAGHEALARPRGFGATDSVEDLFVEAHRSGRIRDLDWLCRRLAIAAVPWPVTGEWALFLNVSAVPLLDPVHGADQMLLVLEASGARADQVVLEITERELITDLGRVRTVLAQYREHGFRFAVDDVGEGHSTLELLAAARPEFIKIARSLTMTAAHSSSRAAIRAAVAFAEVSGALVIGEGIENDYAAGQMIAMGVELGQGMALGRPGSLAPDAHQGELLAVGQRWRFVASPS
jgi:diguanylate cyclase (GGDEF)-like protein/PAS domain S-box-containing protein